MMTTYVKASDRNVNIVNAEGVTQQVTQRAYDVVYKSKGFRIADAKDAETKEFVDYRTLSRDELKKNTNDDLKAYLDANDIEYDSKAVKEDLVNLILGE